MIEGMITITKDAYFRLRCYELKLEMLEGAEVDNWEGYDDALFPKDMPQYPDMVKEIEEEIRNGEVTLRHV